MSYQKTKAMKKNIYTLLASLLLTAPLFAKEVSLQQVEQAARKIYAERFLIYSGSTTGPVVFSEALTLSRNNVPLIHVFNVAGEKGFVMMAAQDNVQPLLAYTFEGAYNKNNEQPAFTDWVENYMDQVAYCVEKALPSTAGIDKAWNMFLGKNVVTATSSANVGPLMSTKWNQGCYYNEQCPTISTGGQCSRAWTGCGATAMAQMMKYHNHPSTGTGSNSYTWMGNTLSANFAASTYNFSSMPNSASSSNTQLAQLMSHAGIALNMNYGSSSSTCFFDMGTILPKYFKYAPIAQNWSKLFITNDTVYQNRIAAELDSLRPVFYKGGGHFYLIDGYQNAYPYYFHVNWGWGGLYDGYYYCSALNPGSYNFTSGQGAIIRIMPQSITTGVEEEHVSGELHLYPNPANEVLNIEWDEPVDNITIINSLGQIVLTNQQSAINDQQSMDIRSLPTGLYFVEVYSGSIQKTSRLVISR